MNRVSNQSDAAALGPQLESLYEISTALARTKTLDEVGAVVAGVASAIDGCNSMIVSVLDGSRKEMRLVGSWGLPQAAVEKWSRFSAESNVGAAISARTGRPLWIEGPEQWAGLVASPQYASAVCLPLTASGGVTIGAIGVGYATYRTFDEHDRRFLLAVAAQCSLAVERCLLFEVEHIAHQEAQYNAARFELLLAMTQAMAERGTSFDQAAQQLTEKLAELLGDVCILRMVSDSGRMHTVAYSHAQPEGQAALGKLWSALGDTSAEIGLLHDVLSSGDTLFLPHVPDPMLRRFTAPPISDYLTRFGISTLIVVPLRIDGQIRGLLTIARGHEGKPYTVEDKRLLEEAAQRASVYLENASRREETSRALALRDEFLSIAAHELKTPITSLSLLLQLVGARLGVVAVHAPELERALELGKLQIQRINHLIADMIDVAKIESGKLAMSMENCELAAIVQENVELLQGREDTPLLHVSLEPVTGIWDAQRLSQVVANLLNNAIKFGRGNPIEVTLHKEGSEAVLRVADEGIGIPADKLGVVFDRFERVIPEKHFQGMGLGLYIVKQIVDAHHGSVRVESVLGQGSVFTVRLPAISNPMHSGNMAMRD